RFPAACHGQCRLRGRPRDHAGAERAAGRHPARRARLKGDVPVRASVQPLPEPGHATLRITEVDAAPQGLTISIERQQGPESHLADDGWRRTETWLQPDRVERRRDVLEFHLGPEICDRLAGIATVRLRVREPDIGVVGTTVVAWPAMLTSGAVGRVRNLDDDTVPVRTPEPPPPH